MAEDYEKTYEEFWKDLVENPDGTLNVDQVKRELSDFKMLIRNVMRVYEHVTGGQVSKPLTDPEIVNRLADDYSRKLCDEEIAEMQEMIQEE